MNNRMVISFKPGNTPIHQLNGGTKVLGFLLITVYIIMTFDIRMLIPMLVFCVALIVSMKPYYKPLLFMFCFMMLTVIIWGSFILFFASPGAGLTQVGQETVIYRWSDYLYLTYEFLWYAAIFSLKRIVSFMSVMAFALSITPSEIAAGLNFARLPYKVCTIISLAFRTIPGIARDYINISQSMQMRGVEMSRQKASVLKRLKQSVLLIVPLILSSFEKVGNIANAMDLRSYGKMKKRTWYSEHEPSRGDKIARAVLLGLFIYIVYYILWFRLLNPYPARYWYPWWVI